MSILAEQNDTVTLYKYEILNEEEGVGIYTEPVTQSRAAELPKYYSQFPPQINQSNEHISMYFDGRGWTSGPALKTITTSMIARALKRRYDNIYQSEMLRLLDSLKTTTTADVEAFEFTYQIAQQYQQGNQMAFRMLLASEEKENATPEDANAISEEVVDEKVRVVIARYHYSQFRKASIVGNYRRLCSQAEEKAKTVVIVKELLHGHGG